MKSHNVGKSHENPPEAELCHRIRRSAFPCLKKKKDSLCQSSSQQVSCPLSNYLEPQNIVLNFRALCQSVCGLGFPSSHKVVTSKITILLHVFFSLWVTNIQITLQALLTGTKLRLLFSSCKKRGNCTWWKRSGGGEMAALRKTAKRPVLWESKILGASSSFWLPDWSFLYL